MINDALPRKRSHALAAGVLHYFTGVPCKNGHLETRLAGNGQCRGCRLEKDRVAYAADPKRHIARKAEWSKRNPDKVRAQRARRAARPLTQEQLERKRASGRKYNKLYPHKNREKRQRWRAANPERTRLLGRVNAAKRRHAEGNFTAADIENIRVAQNNLCVYCDADLRSVKESIDHIIPLARGGTNWPCNLQLLCRPCNSKKYATMPADFVKRLLTAGL